MKKEEILSKITDEAERNAVKTILEYAEQTAKSAEMSAEKFAELFTQKAESLNIEIKKIEGLQKQADDLGILINEMKEAKKTTESKSMFEQVKSNLEANIEKLKSLKKGEKMEFEFSVKSGATTMLESTNLAVGIPLEQRIPGFNPIPQRTPFIAQLIGSGTASSNIISWVYEASITGGAGGTLEGTVKNLIDATFEIGKEDIKKRTVMCKVSEEMLEDVDFMASYITNTLLTQKLALDIDNQILNGNNVSTNYNGIVTQAESFAAGTLAGTVLAPNLRDVILAAIDQIKLANHSPNVIVLHPTDMTALMLAKNKDEQPLYPELALAERSLGGLPVVTNNGVAKGYFLVMDGTKAVYYTKGGIVVKTGWEGSDFKLNLRTIIAETRGALVIETNNTTAFVYDSIATAKAALEATT